jgi:RND family efflux transporter MFP subunit
MQNRWKLWLAAVTAIAILLVLARFLSSPKTQAAAPTPPKTVVAQTVAELATEPALALTGSIEAVQEAAINPQVSGMVAGVQVKNGDAVTPGQPLILLDASSFRDALAVGQANLESAQAGLESASQTYQRDQVLSENNALSTAALENAKVAMETAQAAVDSAAATVSSAQDSLKDTTICSPISGVAANCNVEVGQYLSPGVSPSTPLLVVEDISSVYAVVDIEQDDLPAVRPGLAAKVTADAFGDRVFAGTVEQINPVGDATSRVFETKIRVANGLHLLQPGMFVKVEITTGTPIEVIAVPQNVVVSSAGLDYVFVVDGGRVQRQQVQTGQVLGQMVEITSGLAEGQKVVLTDVDTLHDQDRVTVTSYDSTGS